jgi:hypothetical protein
MIFFSNLAKTKRNLGIDRMALRNQPDMESESTRHDSVLIRIILNIKNTCNLTFHVLYLYL